MNSKLVTGILMILLSMVSVQPPTWQQTCVDAPYAYFYEDSTRQIAINTIEVDRSVGFVVDVQISSSAGFHVGSVEKGITRLSVMAEEAGAVLAVNADNYRSHATGVIIRNGQCIRQKSTGRHLLAVGTDGNFQMIADRKTEKPSELAERLLEEKTLHTFEFGPILVQDSEAVEIPAKFKLISISEKRREPRTAIGMISPLHYVIVVVDGRQPGYSEGISLQTLQQIFVDLGVTCAFNLDGGGSTELWFQGEIINKPSGGERGMSDCIWF